MKDVAEYSGEIPGAWATVQYDYCNDILGVSQYLDGKISRVLLDQAQAEALIRFWMSQQPDRPRFAKYRA